MGLNINVSTNKISIAKTTVQDTIQIGASSLSNPDEYISIPSDVDGITINKLTVTIGAGASGQSSTPTPSVTKITKGAGKTSIIPSNVGSSLKLGVSLSLDSNYLYLYITNGISGRVVGVKVDFSYESLLGNMNITGKLLINGNLTIGEL